MTAAAPSVSPLFRLTVRMLFPLPGSSGYRMEQSPISSPAAAIVGIRIQVFIVMAGRARAMMWLKASPTPSASGDSTIAKALAGKTIEDLASRAVPPHV